MTTEIEFSHRISYGETDAMGIVYYAEYLHFFERARSELIRSKGMSYAKVEEEGLFLPVREASCRYKRPAKYDEIINIKCTVAGQKKASMTFKYEIHNEDHSILHATGMTEHALVNREGRPVRIPEWLSEMLT
ncbi:MAG: acyl-CoA thioesterase [Desulfovibrio sp.]